MTLSSLYNKAMTLADTPPMPLLFVGHGSPMNVIEQNEFTQEWTRLHDRIPTPSAIVCISAHWLSNGTFVNTEQQPKTIHDFYGFPNELYRQQYPASGSPTLAQTLIDTTTYATIQGADDWGLDHGAWSVLKYIYPQAEIPVIQISIDQRKDLSWHYRLAQQLSFLRTKGVLVVGSGNMIHNLRMIALKSDDFNAEHGYDWAFEINDVFKQKIMNSDVEALIRYQSLHADARLAIPTLDHYIPLVYTLAMQTKKDEVKIFNDKVIAGSLSMTSVWIGE